MSMNFKPSKIHQLFPWARNFPLILSIGWSQELNMRVLFVRLLEIFWCNEMHILSFMSSQRKLTEVVQCCLLMLLLLLALLYLVAKLWMLLSMKWMYIIHMYWHIESRANWHYHIAVTATLTFMMTFLKVILWSEITRKHWCCCLKFFWSGSAQMKNT